MSISFLSFISCHVYTYKPRCPSPANLPRCKSPGRVVPRRPLAARLPRARGAPRVIVFSRPDEHFFRLRSVTLLESCVRFRQESPYSRATVPPKWCFCGVSSDSRACNKCPSGPTRRECVPPWQRATPQRRAITPRTVHGTTPSGIGLPSGVGDCFLKMDHRGDANGTSARRSTLGWSRRRHLLPCSKSQNASVLASQRCRLSASLCSPGHRKQSGYCRRANQHMSLRWAGTLWHATHAASCHGGRRTTMRAAYGLGDRHRRQGLRCHSFSRPLCWRH